MFMVGVLVGLVALGFVIGIILSKTQTDSQDTIPTPFAENQEGS